MLLVVLLVLLLWCRIRQQEWIDNLSYSVRAIYLSLCDDARLCFPHEKGLTGFLRSCHACFLSVFREISEKDSRKWDYRIYDKRIYRREFLRARFQKLRDERDNPFFSEYNDHIHLKKNNFAKSNMDLYKLIYIFAAWFYRKYELSSKILRYLFLSYISWLDYTSKRIFVQGIRAGVES